jgi:hypothetical protein
LNETVGMGISANYRIRLKGELAGKGMLEFAHQTYSHEQLKV